MASINYLTAIEFEAGALSRVAAVVQAHGISRPLIVTDPGLASSGLLARLRTHLGALAGAEFTATPPNPDEQAVEAAALIYRESRCDGVVAFGGGSSIDLGKAVALLATHGGPLEQYALIHGGLVRITSAIAPVIAIPTTAGTGSEVGRGALISLGDGRKLGLISPHLIPRVALCDPDLTLGLPPGLTAATGMDALTHCIETYLSPRVNPPADAIALDGAARAARWIERAWRDGSDAQARWHMMMASLQGGLTFQKGLGAVHSMSHPLGALKALSLHHGTLNAVILPAVLRFNEGYAGDKYAELARAMRVPAGQDLAGFIAALNARMGLPASLTQMGVTQAMAEQVIDGAMADHWTATNPRPLERGDFVALFADAMGSGQRQ
jgi:4-hydroxybutyrate dehydrogenase